MIYRKKLDWPTFMLQEVLVYLNHFYVIRPKSYRIRWNYAAVWTITPSVVRYPRYLDTYRRYLRGDTSIANVTIYRGIS